MNTVTKFTSKDPFDYQKWFSGQINEVIKEAENKYKTSFTKEEMEKLINILLGRGLTLHFYFSGRIVEKDISIIRGSEKKEKPAKQVFPKCKRCTIRLDRPGHGVGDGVYCGDCLEELAEEAGMKA